MEIKKIKELIEKQKEWRQRECLNLIASENTPSPLVEELNQNPFAFRYAEGLPYKRYYSGTKYIDVLEDECMSLARKAFNCKYVDIRLISGTIANLAALSSLISPYANVYVNSTSAGGHVSHSKSGIGGILRINHYSFPLLEENKFKIDIDATIRQITKIQKNPFDRQIDLLLLGKSLTLYREPIKELSVLNIPIMMDMAHTLGLWDVLQNPLKEGAIIVSASTHKSFPAIHGGILLSNKELNNKTVFPGVVSNHHLNRIPALIQCFKEFIKYGKSYAKDTIANARTLMKELMNNGFNCGTEELTDTHQCVIMVDKFGGGHVASKKLEKNNIIVNKNLLPGEEITKKSLYNPSGIRIGVQEMTHFGMKKKEMKYIAQLIKDVLIDNKNVKDEVIKLRKKFGQIRYCDKVE